MAGNSDTYDRRSRGLWIGLALPGVVWLLVLFVVPFYVMLAVAGGGINEFFQTVVPVWNPLNWSSWNLPSSPDWRAASSTRPIHQARC